MEVLSSVQAMTIALQEAKKGLGFVSPNPPVGCVILDKKNRLLAKGYHQKYGESHAEINALQQINDISLLDGAHVYVTLEPCSHQGKTGSCAKKLIEFPLASVTYGLIDPFAEVSGKGIELLEKAGIATIQLTDLKRDLTDLVEIFVINQTQQRPFVSIKMATSLDGQMALSETGESQWITGEDSRQHSHYLRGIHDATLVGINTVLRDDPRLNIRHPLFQNKSSRVIILDPQLKIHSKPSWNLLAAHHRQDIYVIHAKEQAKTKLTGVNYLKCKYSQGEFDIGSLLKLIYDHSIYSIYIEGGAKTYESFIRHKKVDRIYNFIAPMIIGSADGLSWTQHLGLKSLAHKIELIDMRHLPMGQDILVTARFAL